jgi:hypothetical protein
MKKLILPVMAVAIMLAASCKKDNPNNNTNNYSTWSFKGASYTGDSCELYNGFFEVWPNGSNGLNNYIFINFPSNALPGAGSYRVVPYSVFYSATVNVAVVGFTCSTGTYMSTGNGSNQTLTVTVPSPGKVVVSGTGIVLLNGSGDSSTLNLNMIQTF